MKNPVKETSPLHPIHVALQAFGVAQAHIRSAHDAATKDLNPQQAAVSARAAATALAVGAKLLEDLHATLSGKTLPVPPGPDHDENVFRRDFAFALMAHPSTYATHVYCGRESNLFPKGSATSLVAIVAPPANFDPNDPGHIVEGEGGWSFPMAAAWDAWVKRTLDVAANMPGVHVPLQGATRGVRAPWNPIGEFSFRVPGIVRDVAAAP